MSLTTSEAAPERDEATLEHELIKISGRAWGVAFGLVLGFVIFVATNFLVLKGGENVGHHLGRLSHVFPGYDVSFAGSIVGFVYFFVVGYGVGRIISPRRPVEAAEAARLLTSRHPPIHGHVWGLGIGLLGGIGLFFVTLVLVLAGGENAGALLATLSLYLPGYSVTLPGAFVGLCWMLALGYVVGRAVAALYNRFAAALS